MPQVGDGGGGIAGDRAASSLIGKNAASKACATARFRLAVGRCGSRIVIPKVMTLARVSPPNPAKANIVCRQHREAARPIAQAVNALRVGTNPIQVNLQFCYPSVLSAVGHQLGVEWMSLTARRRRCSHWTAVSLRKIQSAKPTTSCGVVWPCAKIPLTPDDLLGYASCFERNKNA